MILEMAAGLSRLGSDATFRLVGDGPERPSLLALRDRMGLEYKVEMPGASHRIPQELAGFDIFLLASEREGMPNAILEAMAAGKPVVASRVTGTVDVVRHGSTGLLFDPVSVEDAVLTLNRLLDDEALRGRMGAEARRLAVTQYSAEAMVEGTIQVYRELGMEAA
jgi:glycosyltransferase involved in cell wall biosynthesis